MGLGIASLRDAEAAATGEFAVEEGEAREWLRDNGHRLEQPFHTEVLGRWHTSIGGLSVGQHQCHEEKARHL